MDSVIFQVFSKLGTSVTMIPSPGLLRAPPFAASFLLCRAGLQVAMPSGAQGIGCSSTRRACRAELPQTPPFCFSNLCVRLPGNFLPLSPWFPFANLSRFLSIPPGLPPSSPPQLPSSHSRPVTSRPEAQALPLPCMDILAVGNAGGCSGAAPIGAARAPPPCSGHGESRAGACCTWDASAQGDVGDVAPSCDCRKELSAHQSW